MASSYHYRKIYTEHHEVIPIDENGRTFEIHHKDGNRSNNDISNLVALSIEDHYKAHYDNGEYGACVLIAKRMNLPPDHISKIQTGIKRPGIGGRTKGCIGWNKGKSGYKLKMSDEGIKRKRESIKNRAKIKDEDADKIRNDYDSKIEINNQLIGKTMKNGRLMTYQRAFCLEYAKKFEVTSSYIYRIITRKSHD